MKAKMNARESKALAGLTVAIRAKAIATRKLEENVRQMKELETKRERILADLAREAREINAEHFKLQEQREAASQDVKLALQATSNESLTLNHSLLTVPFVLPFSEKQDLIK